MSDQDIKLRFNVDQASELLKKVGGTEELAAVKDMTIHLGDDGKAPAGYKNIAAWADVTSQPGNAILRAGTVVDAKNIPKKVYDDWKKNQKIAPKIMFRVITTERHLRKLVQLLYTTKETSIYELSDSGGFNTTVNHNVGVHNVEDPKTYNNEDEGD